MENENNRKMTSEEFQHFLYSELILLNITNKALIDILKENNISTSLADEKIIKYKDECGKELDKRIEMYCANLGK